MSRRGRRGRNLNVGLLQYASFNPYRKLGFALWDEKTMAELGFWLPQVMDKPSEYCSIWLNVLNEKEIAQAIEHQEDDW